MNKGKQICIDNNDCPIEYPYLKSGTFECSKCYYKYHNECYSSCPNKTYINQTIDDINICIDIISEEITEIEDEILTTDITTGIYYKLLFQNNEILFDEECPDNNPFQNKYIDCIEECDVISFLWIYLN